MQAKYSLCQKKDMINPWLFSVPLRIRGSVELFVLELVKCILILVLISLVISEIRRKHWRQVHSGLKFSCQWVIILPSQVLAPCAGWELIDLNFRPLCRLIWPEIRPVKNYIKSILYNQHMIAPDISRWSYINVRLHFFYININQCKTLARLMFLSIRCYFLLVNLVKIRGSTCFITSVIYRT